MPDLSDSRTQYSKQSHNQVDNIAEQDIIEFITLRDNVHIDLDVDALSQSITIRMFERVDGTNYSQVDTVVFPDDFDTDVKIVGLDMDGGGQDMKLTAQSVVAEGMDRTIPFILETLTRP